MSAFDLSADSGKRPYGRDKFGFMLADLANTHGIEISAERNSRSRKALSPFHDRNEAISPKRNEMIRDNRPGRHDKRDDRDRRELMMDRRDERERFSPYREDFFRDEPERRRKRSSERKDYIERPESWERQFNQPTVNTYPSHPPPVTSFPSEQMAHFPPHGYGDQYTSGAGSGIYAGYPTSVPPPPTIQPLMSDLPQAPHPPDIQWGHIQPAAVASATPEDDHVKKEAIASEVRQQKATLVRQREEYLRKVDALKRELETLREQRAELRGSSRRSPSPDSRRFLKENAKLQLEIHNKLKTMNNVIDMLSGIIGEAPRPVSPGEKAEKKERKAPMSRSQGRDSQSSSDSSPDRDKKTKKKSRSRSRSVNTDKKFNYVYYDPEMHWCRICNDFPSTAKDYLTHLHAPQHSKNAVPHMEAPWHSVTNLNEGLPSFPSAPSKRTPIRGLQFFIPSTAWYCKLCDQWIGDLHCASAHLKSLVHSKNYTTFVEQNPHWEIDWMSDRQKAFQKARTALEANEVTSQPYSAHTITFDKDGFRTKRKTSPAEDSETGKGAKKDKKKKKDKKIKKRKKRSSSSSSQSSKSSEPSKAPVKKSKPANAKEQQQEGWRRVSSPSNTPTGGEDRMLSQWMSLQDDRLSEHDKRVLQNLKNRVKYRIAEEASNAETQYNTERKNNNHSMGRQQVHAHSNATQQRSVKDGKDQTHPRSREGDRHRESRENRHERDREREEKPRPQQPHHNTVKHHPQEQDKEKDRKNQEQKKMPFIGKMPVFKTLTKPATKAEESKKMSEQVRGGEENDIAQKKRAEINAQIQKTVQEFKDKLKQQQEAMTVRAAIGAPGVALPTALGGVVTAPLVQPLSAAVMASLPQTIHRIQKQPMVTTSAPTTVPPSPKPKPPSNKDDPLHKDFQEALDIIFPSEEKKATEVKVDEGPLQIADMSIMPPGMPSYGMMAGPMGYMPQPPMGMMGPMPPGPFGYDFNAMFPQQAHGMYDMSMHMGPHQISQENGDDLMPPPEDMQPPPLPNIAEKLKVKSIAPPPKYHEMDDLAMLGIEAEDVGASGF